jgi:hypothetical protein
MQRRNAGSNHRPRRAIRLLAAACALAFATGVAAQTVDPLAEPYPVSPYGTEVPQQKPRGLFAMTIAALVAQGIGGGIANGLSQGISGSIANWFASRSGAGAPLTTAALDDLSPRTDSFDPPAPALHAGVAYEVHLVGRESRAIDPKTHVFRTGDQFQVYYRPTLPGRITVSNINPKGTEAALDSIRVAAGQLLVLGPYQFVDKQGNETLRIVLSPCSTPTLMVATRTIVKAPGASATNDAPVRIADCDSPTTRALSAKTRDIRKTSMDGLTGFALDRVSDEEVASGEIAPRETRIRLRHR